MPTKKGNDWASTGSSLKAEFRRGKAPVPDKLRRRDNELSVYFIESELKAIEHAAKQADVSKSDIVRQIVRKAFRLGKDNEAVRRRKPTTT